MQPDSGIRPSAAGRKLTAVDKNAGVNEDLKPSAPNKLSELHKPVASEEPQTLSAADPQPPMRAGGVSPSASMDGGVPSSSSLGGSKEGSVRSERSKLGQSQMQSQTLAAHTTNQVQVQQEFHERGDVMRQISEVDHRTDRDFFLSMATTKAKEARRAPWDTDGHPLMQAAASGDGNGNGNESFKSAVSKGQGHHSKSRSISGSGSGLSVNAGAGASVSASCVDVQMILEELGPLESVTQVYARDFYGRTPLHIAALNGCAGTVYHLMNSYRKNMFRTGVQDNIARLERERAVSATELRAALIASGTYTASSWDLKVKRMNELASKAKASSASASKTDAAPSAASKGSTVPQLVALQHWFDEEVERVHRAHEVRVEVYRTKLLSTKDKFRRTPLHYACASGCPPAVLEALLQCSTACVGISHKEHSHFNMQHSNTVWDAGNQHQVRNPRSLFSSGVIYESATGMEIGRTDGGLSPALSVAPSTSSIQEATRLINKSLRNVAWELTHEQSALGAPTPVKEVLQPGQRPGEEHSRPLQKVPRDDSPPATFAEDQEQMFEVIIPWVCRNVLGRAADLLTRDQLDSLKTRAAGAGAASAGADAKGDDTHRAQGTVASGPSPGPSHSSSVDCFEKLQSLIAEVQLLGHSASLHEAAGLDSAAVDSHSKCLLVPELNHLLAKLGIQVTKAVVAELCARYPAGTKASSEKWKAVQQIAKARKELEKRALADRKTGTAGRNGSDRGDKGGSDAKSDGYADNRAEAKEKETEAPYGTAEAKAAPHSSSHSTASDRDGPDRSKLEALISSFAGGYYDTDEGLDVDFFVRELRNGRAVQSITKMRKTYADFNDNGTGNAYTIASSSNNIDKGIAKFCDGDEKRIAELRELLEDSTGAGAAQGAGAGGAATAASLLAQLACCVSVSSIIRVRKQLINLTDSYGRTPLLIAAANGHKELVELLLACGGDTSIPATYQSSSNISPAGGYRYNALSLSATGSIRSLLEKALLAWLNRANLDGYLGASVTRSADGNADVLAVLNNLSNDGKVGRRTLVEAKSSFSVGLASSIRGGIGLGLNEAYLHTSEEDLQYKDANSALAAKSQLVLGMREHLQMLQSKNWAYSRSPLAWAVNNGLAEVVRRLLEERADPNETDTTGRTALHEAAALVSTGADSLADAALDCAELLLRACADPNKGSVGSRSPVHELFCKGQDDSSSSFGSVVVASAADMAGGHGGSRAKVCFKINDGYTAAQRLLRSRRKRRFLRLLLQFGGDSQQLDRMGMSPVHLAARENDAGCVLEMLRYGAAAGSGSGGGSGSGSGSTRSSREGGISSGDSNGGSVASSRPSTATAYTLSARSAQTPLHVACRAGAAQVIQLLCRWEADLPKGGRSASLPHLVDSQGKVAAQYLTPALSPAVLDTLWSLAHAGAVAKLRTLLSSMQHANGSSSSTDEYLDDVDASDDDDIGGNMDSAHEGVGTSVAATVSGYVADSAELANNHAADYGAEQRSRLRTSRSAGIRKSSSSSAQEPWLVDGVNAKTRRLRWTPLHACLSGWIGSLAAAGNTAAKRVVSRSSGSSSGSGSGSGKSSPTRPAKASSLSSTSANLDRYQDTLALLIQNHCYIDGADWQCRTPLMFAAAANLGAAIDVLLAAGADVFAKDLDGNTALHVAYAYGSAGAAATLEDRMATGASKGDGEKDVTNYAGQTPFDIAGDVMRVKNLLV